jgi:Transglycosylase SLT domain
MLTLCLSGIVCSIPSVNDPDNNIHAGTKMLAQITKTYFNDPAITPTNKALFAFAAYNAGPNRIVRLRKEAGKEGRSQHLIRQCGLVVAKDIDQETVRCDSSVYESMLPTKWRSSNSKCEKRRNDFLLDSDTQSDVLRSPRRERDLRSLEFASAGASYADRLVIYA